MSQPDRFYCVRHLPPTNGASCSIFCRLDGRTMVPPNCAFVRDRLDQNPSDQQQVPKGES